MIAHEILKLADAVGDLAPAERHALRLVLDSVSTGLIEPDAFLRHVLGALAGAARTIRYDASVDVEREHAAELRDAADVLVPRRRVAADAGVRELLDVVWLGLARPYEHGHAAQRAFGALEIELGAVRR